MLTRKRTGNLAMWGTILIIAGMFVLPFMNLGDIGVYGAIVLAGFHPSEEIHAFRVAYWLIPINGLLAVAYAVTLWRGIPPRWIGYALLVIASLALAVMLVHLVGALSEGQALGTFIWGFWVTIAGIILTGMAYARGAAGFE